VEVIGDILLLDEDGGSTISANGLEISNDVDMVDYATSSIRLVGAELGHFTMEGEFLVGQNPLQVQMYPNHCDAVFGTGSTSHRLRVITNGGFAVDGVVAYTPTDKEIFDIFMRDGSHIDGAKYLGLTDLTDIASDGDNTFDLCLNLSDSEAGIITHTAIHFILLSPPPGRGKSPISKESNQAKPCGLLPA
jgi:hypothetical protein